MGGAQRKGCAVLLSALAMLLLPAAAQGSSGTVFFGGWYDEAIGSVAFDGSDPNPDLIVGDGTIPEAMTVSGDYLYWEANSWPIRIGRTRLDGSEVSSHFLIGGSGASEVAGVSVNHGRIYWAETRGQSGFGPSFLSSAKVDGSGRRIRRLRLRRHAVGTFVVSGRWVFYAIRSGLSGPHSIVRQRLDGKGAARLVPGSRGYVPDTLMSLGAHVYWLKEGRRSAFLARASRGLARIDTRFRRLPWIRCAPLPLGCDETGAAISSSYLFLPWGDPNSIGRVALYGPAELQVLPTGAELSSGPVLAATP